MSAHRHVTTVAPASRARRGIAALPRRISAVTRGDRRPGDQYNPRGSGNHVVFESPDDGGLLHLSLWDLSSGRVYPIPVNPGSGQYLNDISGDRIVYTDDRSVQLDIYLFTFIIGP
jgi:hypothetical protein